MSIFQVSSVAIFSLSDKNTPNRNYFGIYSKSITKSKSTKQYVVNIPVSESQTLLAITTATVLSSVVLPSFVLPTASSKASVNYNMNFKEHFLVCQPDENVCLNKGICYKSPNFRFCRCTGDYIGSLCETKAVSGIDSVVVWLGTICGGLLLLLIISTYFVHMKLNKGNKEKKKLEDELQSVKNQNAKLIAESKNRRRFSSSECSFYTTDYYVPKPYKKKPSDASLQTSNELNFKCKQENLILNDVIDEEDDVKQSAVEKCTNSKQEDIWGNNCNAEPVANINVKASDLTPMTSSSNLSSIRAQSETGLNMRVLNNRYDDKNNSKHPFRYDAKLKNFAYQHYSKSLEMINTDRMDSLSTQFLKYRSNDENIFIGNLTSKTNEELNVDDILKNRVILETLNKRKRKGIWAQQQERKRDYCIY
nr:uncharacterized protein LOC124808696 [Hydra vulgaris]